MQHNHAMSENTGGFFSNLFQSYVPRQQCMFYETELITLHALSDFMIAAAYFSIPMALVYLVRKRNDLAFNRVFLLFALFIVLCGLTHIFGIISLWYAYYRVDGIIKLLTGLVSVATAVVLWRLMPQALALPSIESFRRTNEHLEELVEARTVELTKANTALRESEQRFKFLAQKAEEANQAKTDFLANMSHELRTPLGVVTGLSQVLSNMDGLPDEAKELIGVQQNSARALETLISDLLDISKIHAEHMNLETAPTNLSQLLRGIADIFFLQAKEKDITLEYIGQYGDKAYLGDAARIQQIVTNLVSNAIKFTHRGGVSINLREKPEARDGYHQIEIIISDTGIGIAPEKLEGIFERFNQADNSTTREYGGTGLGLTISRELAQMMGGDIQVASTVNEGSVFTVTMRLMPADVSASAGDSDAWKEKFKAGDIPDADKPLILIADDQPHNLLMLERMLKQMGYVSLTARRGRDALKIIKEQHDQIFAVLMDIQMMEMDGIETTRQIRNFEAKEKLQKLPVIAVTANAQPEIEQACFDAGMDDYIQKPLRMEDILNALDKIKENRES